jgi:Spy/CpxP family protein refolding chaperone
MTSNSTWRAIKTAANEIPNSPTAIVAALALTALALSMVLAQEATSGLQMERANGWVVPAGVFRAPHSTIIAPGLSSLGP